MKELSKVVVPLNRAEDINSGFTTWRDGKCVALNEGAYVTLYIDHSEMEQFDVDGENVVAHKVIYAAPIRVAKPITRDKAINAAEMTAYCLGSAMEVASFNASLNRKYRENPDDKEVIEHDAFISWVKKQLTSIGI